MTARGVAGAKRPWPGICEQCGTARREPDRCLYCESLAVTSTTLTMPIPPSLNAMMSGRLKDRIANKNTAKWEASAAWRDAGCPVFRGPVVADARFYFPDRRRRDRENAGAGGIKAAIDYLVECGCLVGDDHAVFDMTVHMLHDAENPRLELEIRSA